MTASLQTKGKSVYVVLNWQQAGERKVKWVKTDLQLKHGKRAGEAIRLSILKEWEDKLCANYKNMGLGDYLKEWLERRKRAIEETTYREYGRMIRNTLAPYFDRNKVTLQGCTVKDIEKFYDFKMDADGVSANTISHYQACLFSAFKDACRREILKSNPAANVELPKVQKFKSSFCTPDEVEAILEKAKGTWLEIPIYLAIWFGMRREEAIGLRWQDIDFKARVLTIAGVVTYNAGCEPKIKYRNYTKTDAGMRAFPLSDRHIRVFKHWKAEQTSNRLLAGDRYDLTWDGFICVNELGGLISPNYVSWKFPGFIKKNGIRKIRFHDLRHTNAVLLLSNGSSMQEVQSWLGHESYSTTDEFYGGIFAETKKRAADILDSVIGI